MYTFHGNTMAIFVETFNFVSSYGRVGKECDSKSVESLSEKFRILLVALCTGKTIRFLNW